MARYDDASPKDILNEIQYYKNKGFYVQKLNHKKQLAQYYEIVLKDKNKANEIYNEIRINPKKYLLPSPKGSEKEMALFLRDLQVKETGSFVEQPTVSSIEIETAKHILSNLKRYNLKPKYPLKFLNNYDTGAKLKKYFQELLYDFTKDNRDELNLAITALPNIRKRGFHKFSEDWEKSYFECLEIWQDAKTGYWGPWKKKGKNILKIPDLSTTFHILGIYFNKKTFELNNPKYDINYKRKIIETTWKLRKQNYPIGWLEKGKQSTHHNFDVAELFTYLYNELSPKEKTKVQKLFDQFLNWCLNETQKENGGFIGYYHHEKQPTIRSTIFAILMLRAIGYFSTKHRERIWKNTKLKINSYRIYEKEIPQDEFDTRNLKYIIYEQANLDPLDLRSKIYKFWTKNKHEDPTQALNISESLEFNKYPPQKFKILKQIPKLKKNKILVKVDKYGGIISD